MATAKGDLLPDGSYRPDHECPKTMSVGTYHIDAPSGVHRDFVLPDMRQMAIYGEIPNPLAALVLKGEEPSTEDAELFEDLKDVMVAGSLRPSVPVDFVKGYQSDDDGHALRDDDGHALSVEPRMPKEDREEFWSLIVRVKEARKDRREAGDLLGRMMQMAPFRAEQDGAELSGDVLPAGNRSSRRARAS